MEGPSSPEKVFVGEGECLERVETERVGWRKTGAGEREGRRGLEAWLCRAIDIAQGRLSLAGSTQDTIGSCGGGIVRRNNGGKEEKRSR